MAGQATALFVFPSSSFSSFVFLYLTALPDVGCGECGQHVTLEGSSVTKEINHGMAFERCQTCDKYLLYTNIKHRDVMCFHLFFHFNFFINPI